MGSDPGTCWLGADPRNPFPLLISPPTQNAVSKGLLLNSLLGQAVVSTASPSMARKRIMEEERVRVVEAYRHLKKQKQRKQELRDTSLKTLKNL